MLRSAIRQFFGPAPAEARLSPEAVRREYPRYRWRVMEATFLGYAAFYLVRNNVPVVSKDIGAALAYDDGQIGSLLAITAATYGIGKFFMGYLSDRSNPRTFMATGLLLTAICNFAFGNIASFRLHLGLWALNGFFQGMGWPPCGRSMGHWFAEKERGLTFSIWNTSHNVGAAVAGYLAAWGAHQFGGWSYAFFVPGVLTLIGSCYVFLRLCDRPQSVGLPAVEEYRCDAGNNTSAGAGERDLTTRELLLHSALLNRYIWLLAIGNFFAYITRYSMLDWGPKYLREIKGASLMGGGYAVVLLELSGIPSTIALGWVSDRLGGRRGLVAAVCMVPILAAFLVMVLAPKGRIGLDMAMLCIVGFFVYPVINLIVILALDLTGKKAIGTAAGFIGLFGYLGKMAEAQGFGWMLKHFKATQGPEAAWQIVIACIVGCALVGVVLLGMTWRLRPGIRGQAR